MTFAVLGWTGVVMRRNNGALGRRGKQAREGVVVEGREGEETRCLLERWEGLNYVRAGIPMVGCVLGLCGLLG